MGHRAPSRAKDRLTSLPVVHLLKKKYRVLGTYSSDYVIFKRSTRCAV